jgi:CHASE2 domain-containing sensor protein
MPDGELLVNGTAAFTQIELNEETASGLNGIRLPLLAKVGDKVVPSFVLQVIMNQEQIPADQVKVILEGPRPVIRLGKHTIPVERDGTFTVYHGIKGSFPSIEFSSLALAASPFEDVAEKLRQASKASLESLRSNAVIIGYDQEEVREFGLPTGEKISRTELLAMAVATIQTGRHITFWPDLFRYASWGLLGGLGLVLFRWRRFRVIAGSFAILLLYAGLSIGIFQTSLSWTPPWPALGICAVLLILGTVLPSPRRKLTPSDPAPETTAS